MKNKKIIIFSIIVIASLISSFIIYNFNQLTNNAKNEIIEVSYTNEVNNKNAKKVKINYQGFVKKIIINYKTKENIKAKITYNSKDYYDKKTKETKEETFVTPLNKASLPINKKIKNIVISYNSHDYLQIESIEINNKIEFNAYLFIAILLTITALTIIYFYVKHNLFDGKIEKLFFSLVLIVGSLFIILQPATTSYSWDDQIHFMNTYNAADIDGKTDWTTSSDIMKKIFVFGETIDTTEEREVQNNYLNSNDKKIIQSEKKSRFITYNEIGYVVPGIIIKICSWLGINFVLKIMITKFSILLFYALIMYFAIKIIPRGKRIMAVFGMIPTSLFLATQFSYDPPITAMISLFIAQFIKIMESKTKINLKEVLILLISILFASFIKAIYIPLILLVLFIPKEKFNNDKQRKFFKIGSIILFILVMATFVIPAVGTNTGGDLRGGNTSVSGQIKHILNHPFGYMNLLYETAVLKFVQKLIGPLVILNYSYIAREISTNLYEIYITLLIFVTITDSYTKTKLDKKIKIIDIIINLGIILLIWTALYLSFNPVGAKTIEGVQSRYFIPLLMPIILILFSNNKIKHKIDQKKYDGIIMLISISVTLWTIFSVFITKFCL